MSSFTPDIDAELAEAVRAYRDGGQTAELLSRLESVAARASSEHLIEAAEPYRQIPEVAGPLYERIVAERPDDARALVILGNAYWLAGRGPDVVGELADRAIAADPSHRGAWHLWALSEPVARARLARWRQVVARFPEDELAHAVMADNAASLAGGEGDREALSLAIETYEALLARAAVPAQRDALEAALRTLREWRL